MPVPVGQLALVELTVTVAVKLGESLGVQTQVGGRQEPLETADRTVIREFAEETGLAIRVLGLAYVAESFDASKYQDDYRNNVMRIIKAKLKGKKVEVAEPEEPEATPVVDLMAKVIWAWRACPGSLPSEQTCSTTCPADLLGGASGPCTALRAASASVFPVGWATWSRAVS